MVAEAPHYGQAPSLVAGVPPAPQSGTVRVFLLDVPRATTENKDRAEKRIQCPSRRESVSVQLPAGTEEFSLRVQGATTGGI